MKVLKFGGTSVGSVLSLNNVKRILENGTEDKKIVVVSALGGVTDQLIRMAKGAAASEEYQSALEEIKQRHLKIMDEMVDDELKETTSSALVRLFNELSDILQGLSLIKDLSSTTLDLVLSYGERLSSTLISNIIKGSKLLDSRNFIFTRQQWDSHFFDKETSEPAIRNVFEGVKERIIIVPGFISTDAKTKRTTNLGRGGSDYTAAILAATLGASVLEIWTDVDGFMTADPRVIATSYPINHLSFTEAMELCNFGAKVIYPPTLYPVFRADIPILIKNTFNPEAKGTLISSDDEEENSEEKLIKGISSIADSSLLSISGLGMVGIPGINARIFSALANRGISVFMVSQASSENSTSLGVRDVDAHMAKELLEKEFSHEIANGSISDIKITSGLSTVGVVGAKMKHVPGVAGKLFNTLGRNGISMIACAQGANGTNISFVVKTRELRKTLNVIHDSFFLSPTQVLNLFIIGTGKVGSNLIEQIRRQQERLLKDKSLEIKVVGIANSRKAYFNREGIDLSDYRETLKNSGQPMTASEIGEEIIGMNIYNPVFVDCTSNPDIASLYQNMLSHNVNIVAANKISASGPFEIYRQLKRIARERDIKFLFETNVGAGLPIISTLNSLINSGDKILCIEAVVSGTLNFIFNALRNGRKLSEAVKEASEKGFSEPDPRVDLSGEDVVRKIVILAREAGYDISKDDVERKLFIPSEFFEGDLDKFYENLKTFDAEFEQKRKEAADKGAHWRFVARYADGKASVGIEEITPTHPFYNIESSNNVIALTTERYKEYPIVIKGYGAGAEVTAAGVFADIISIANVR